MRTLSLNFRNAIYAQESGQVAVLLLTVTHASLAAPIRISTDPTQRITTSPLVYGTVSRGNTYLFIAAEVQLPDEKDRTPPAAKIAFDNTTTALVPMVRSVPTQASVLIEGVLASAPDSVEFSIPVLQVVSADYDVNKVTFTLQMDALAIEPFPAGSFDPAGFPGLFY